MNKPEYIPPHSKTKPLRGKKAVNLEGQTTAAICNKKRSYPNEYCTVSFEKIAREEARNQTHAFCFHAFCLAEKKSNPKPNDQSDCLDF